MADFEHRLQALEQVVSEKDFQIKRLQKSLYAISSGGKPVDEWDFYEVGNWLEHINLASYRKSFEENEIDGDTLLSIDEDSLKGLLKPFHVRKFMKQLSILRKPRTLPDVSPIAQAISPRSSEQKVAADQREERYFKKTGGGFDARPMVQKTYEDGAENTDPDLHAYNNAFAAWFSAKPKFAEEDEGNYEAKAAFEQALAAWEARRLPTPLPGDLPGMKPLNSEPLVQKLDMDKGTPDEWIKRSPELIRLSGKFPLNAEPPVEILMEHWITPSAWHNVRSHGKTGTTTWENHELVIDGLVDNPLKLSMDDLVNNYPSETFPVLLVCAGHRRKEQNILKKSKGFNSEHCLGNSEYTGVPLHLVLKAAGVQEGATSVNFEGFETLPNGKFGSCLHVNKALDPTQDVILAYKMNGENLPYDHGYPLRIIFPGQVAGRWVKWLTRITVADHESDSAYWWMDNRVWPPMTDTTTLQQWMYRPEYVIMELCIQSCITSPGYNEIIPDSQDTVVVKGYAFSGGGRKIHRVEITLDDGLTWKAAKVHRHEKARHGEMRYWCWTWWELPIDTAQLRDAEVISVRAFDESTNTQPERLTWSALGMYNNSWYRIKLEKDAGGLKCVHPVHQYGGELPWKEHAKLTQGGWLTEYADESVTQALEKKQPEPSSASSGGGGTITKAELKKHNKKDDCWITISGKVYDVTKYCMENKHPGGSAIIWMSKGGDATEGWDSIDHSAAAAKDLAEFYVGDLA